MERQVFNEEVFRIHDEYEAGFISRAERENMMVALENEQRGQEGPNGGSSGSSFIPPAEREVSLETLPPGEVTHIGKVPGSFQSQVGLERMSNSPEFFSKPFESPQVAGAVEDNAISPVLESMGFRRNSEGNYVKEAVSEEGLSYDSTIEANHIGSADRITINLMATDTLSEMALEALLEGE